MNPFSRVIFTSAAVMIGVSLGALAGYWMTFLACGSVVDPDRSGFAAFGWIPLVLTVPIGGIAVGAVFGISVNVVAHKVWPVVREESPQVLWSVRTLLMGIAAYIVGGFFAGIGWADSSDWLIGNPVGRLYTGFEMCLQSAVSFGFIDSPHVKGAHNVWPVIIAFWFAFMGAIYLTSTLVDGNPKKTKPVIAKKHETAISKRP
jgi:hypothetical protein